MSWVSTMEKTKIRFLTLIDKITVLRPSALTYFHVCHTFLTEIRGNPGEINNLLFELTNVKMTM